MLLNLVLIYTIAISDITVSQNIDQEQCSDSNTTDCHDTTYINPNIIITTEQRQSYQENGFLIIQNVLSNDQLELWRTLIDNSVNSRGIDHIFPVKGQSDTVNPEYETYYKNVFIQRVTKCFYNLYDIQHINIYYILHIS